MYTFPDKGGNSLTLRPRVHRRHRAGVRHRRLAAICPLKLVTSGAVFRYERPQKGRYRQFHQIDAEILGAPEPAADVELLCLGRPAAARAGHRGRRHAPAQHPRRRRHPRRVARRAGRAFRGAPGRVVGGQRHPPRQEPAPHPQFEGPARPPHRRRRPPTSTRT
ncbi:aminoacyl--tRNA ligase-related protein [Sphingomonas sp. MMS24-JH45]